MRTNYWLTFKQASLKSVCQLKFQKMKKVIVMVVVLATTALVSHAQDTSKVISKKEWARAEGKKSRDSIIQELNLSKDQLDRLQKLVQDGKTRRESIWKDNTLNDEQKKEKMLELRAEGRTKLGDILTREQQDKLQRLHHKANAKYSRQTEPADQLLDMDTE